MPEIGNFLISLSIMDDFVVCTVHMSRCNSTGICLRMPGPETSSAVGFQTTKNATYSQICRL